MSSISQKQVARIKKISIVDYRNIKLFCTDFNSDTIIILGNNGLGKTNILESISLLAPGRGMRVGTKFDHIITNQKISQNLVTYDNGRKYVDNDSDIQNHTQMADLKLNEWNISSHIYSKLGDTKISQHYDNNKRARKIIYNGTRIASSDLTKFVNILWMTPQLHLLFLESASSRMKFFDRIVANFENDYIKLFTQYESYIKNRLEVLLHEDKTRNNSQNVILDDLERKIISCGLSIIKKRYDALSLLRKALNELKFDFVNIDIHLMHQFLEDKHSKDDEGIILGDDILSHYVEKLKRSRKNDVISKRTNCNILRGDFTIEHITKNQNIKYCSTGEQQAALIGFLIAQTHVIIEKYIFSPIVLLDEVFVHLDKKISNNLMDYMMHYEVQKFITSTDIAFIDKLSDNIDVIDLNKQII